MMDDELTFFAGGSMVEALCRCREHLLGSPLLNKLDEVIAVELEIALIAAKKAKSKTADPKDNLRPIK